MSDVTRMPALLGGPPIRPQGPPPWPPDDPEVLEALQAAYRDGSWGKYDGGNCARLAEALCAYHGVEFALPVGSGTFAVELALRAVGVGPGDEVLLAGYDYGGNFLAVHAVGAHPVLIDVAPHNWNLDVDRIGAALGKPVKAIIASHLHGGLVPMRELMACAGDCGLAVIEDAAQCPGAMVQGRMAGTWGDAGILSFGGSKLLTAGRGGALLTPRAVVHQRARTLLMRGNLVCPLSELQAAVLVPQLSKLDSRNRIRMQNVRLLAEILGSPLPPPAGTAALADSRVAGGEGLGVRGEFAPVNESPAAAHAPLTPDPSPPADKISQETQPVAGGGRGEARRSPDPDSAAMSHVGGVPGLVLFCNPDEPGNQPGYYKVGFQYDAAAFGLPRERFLAAMRAEGIAMDAGFAALHVGRSPKRFRRGSILAEAEKAHEGALILHHPVLLQGDADIGEIAAAAIKVHAQRAALG